VLQPGRAFTVDESSRPRPSWVVSTTLPLGSMTRRALPKTS
jgi:hypothetical protein